METWIKEYNDKITSMDGIDLLEEYTDLAGGDDYDGCWTRDGKVKWDIVRNEFETRLRALGFLETITFYCDNSRHLVCKPYSIRNLHIMAGELKIPYNWFHAGKRKKAHYDIPKTRIEEIKAKCTVVSSKEILNIINGVS